MSKLKLRIAEGVLVQTSELWNTNSVLITGIGDAARAAMVVDPGWFPGEIEELREAAAATVPGRATHVLFTHGDYDHVVGWEDFPNDIIVAHPDAAKRNPREVEDLVASLDRRNHTARAHPYRYPPVRAFTSPPTLDLGGETALFFPAPGHQPDGLFTVLPNRRILVAGDYLSDEEFPFISHSLSEYRKTLRLARDLCRQFAITQEIPGHGKVASTPEEIEYRISTDLDYLNRLEKGVSQAKSEGLNVEDTIKRLSEFTFRGEPISGLARAHAENIRRLFGEEPREWIP